MIKTNNRSAVHKYIPAGGKHQERCDVPMDEKNIILSMTFPEAVKQVGGIRQGKTLFINTSRLVTNTVG